MTGWRAGATAAMALITTAASACGDDGPSWPQDAARAVVVVEAVPCDRPTRSSGVGVRLADGMVVTAAHTVEGSLRGVRVDGRPAAVAAIDPRTDLALLDVTGDRGPEAALAPPATARTGASLWLLSLDGETPRIDAVDAVRRTRLTVDDVTDGRRYARQAIAFAGTVNDGTSGAPLVTAGGEVAGIVTVTARQRGVSYAVAGTEVARLVDERDERSLEPVGSCA